jgi:hypothetical protein
MEKMLLDGLEFFGLESNPKREYHSVHGDQTSVMRYEITKETGGYSIDGTLELSSGITSRFVKKIALEPDWISVATDFHIMDFESNSLGTYVIYRPTIPKLPRFIDRFFTLELQIYKDIKSNTNSSVVQTHNSIFTSYFDFDGHFLICVETKTIEKDLEMSNWEIYAKDQGCVAILTEPSDHKHRLDSVCYTLLEGYPIDYPMLLRIVERAKNQREITRPSQSNRHSKAVSYYTKDLCPLCKLFHPVFHKASRGRGFLYCDFVECDQIYLDPRKIEAVPQNIIDEWERSRQFFSTGIDDGLGEVFMSGETGLMNLDEIKAMGWEDLIGGTY